MDPIGSLHFATAEKAHGERICMTQNNAEKAIKKIITAAAYIHTHLGPGLQIPIYETTLAMELEKRSLKVQEHALFSFQENPEDYYRSFRVSLLVESSVLVNLIVEKTISRVTRKSMLSNLHWARKEEGLILNYGVQQNFRRDGVLKLNVNELKV